MLKVIASLAAVVFITACSSMYGGTTSSSRAGSTATMGSGPGPYGDPYLLGGPN